MLSARPGGARALRLRGQHLGIPQFLIPLQPCSLPRVLQVPQQDARCVWDLGLRAVAEGGWRGR